MLSVQKIYEHLKNIRNWEFHKGRWGHMKSNKYFLGVWGTLGCANLPLLLKGSTWLAFHMVLSKAWCDCRTRVTRHTPNCLAPYPEQGKVRPQWHTWTPAAHRGFSLSPPALPTSSENTLTLLITTSGDEFQWTQMALCPERQMANQQHLHSRPLAQKFVSVYT